MSSRHSDATRKAVIHTVLHKGLVKKQPFEDLIRDVGDFAVDLVFGDGEEQDRFLGITLHIYRGMAVQCSCQWNQFK